MFDFLLSKNAKARREATQWLEIAEKIHHYRRDLLSGASLAELQVARDDVKAKIKAKADTAELKPAVERLEKVMRATGGTIYPHHSLVENVEFFLVAAIVILGLRAYFVQPFKIPTNSMWPSYYGMTAESFSEGQEPGPLQKAFRLVTLGAFNYAMEAPADGEVMIPVFREGIVAYAEKPGRSMLIFPSLKHQYTFRVGREEVSLQVPAEFIGEFNKIIEERFKGDAPNLGAMLRQSINRAGPNLEMSTWRYRDGAEPRDSRVYWVPTGRKVHKGEKLVSFDILTGDLLFVERISYNFVEPKIGSGFVFKTGNIPALRDEEGSKYFVKRLVGAPGDTLEVRPPRLYRNDKPIEGSKAFEWNANKVGLYPGYVYMGSLGEGDTVKVPPHYYFGMGDNSPNSRDSRSWGFVPEKDVVGRPLFIYYPLTKRWGPTH